MTKGSGHSHSTGRRVCFAYKDGMTRTNVGDEGYPADPDRATDDDDAAPPERVFGNLIRNAENIVLTPTTTSQFDEGRSGTFEVHLSAASASDATMMPTKTNSAVTVSPITLSASGGLEANGVTKTVTRGR